MLLEGMTPAELNTAIYRDYNIISESSTQERLEEQYFHLRKKLHIDKTLAYPVFNTIKTKAKNHWLLLTRRNPEVDAVNTLRDLVTGYYVYYHTHKGFRVFNPCSSKTLMVYNGHLFTRYRERMNLTITDPVEIIKQFFVHNSTYPVIKKFRQLENGFIPFISFEKEGYLMGDIEHLTDKYFWAVFKTFVSFGTASAKKLGYSESLRLAAAQELLKYKMGVIQEMGAVARKNCDVMGLLDKEITIPFLEHIIANHGKLK